MLLRPHQQKALDAMLAYDKGQVIIPTGGGKTMCMIYDILENQKYIDNGSTVVVVAPRILLAEQLCKEFLEVIDDTHTHVMHVHSGETEFFSSTKPEKIALFNNVARSAGENCIIFTTYHSLHKVQEADIEVNTIYFDKRTTQFNVTFSLLRSTLLLSLVGAISSLLLLSILCLCSNLA